MMKQTLSLMMVAALTLSSAELPLTRVVIYKNGVAYYERAGTVAAGEAARLEFRADEMNDVLKSLVVEDRGGGAVTQVRYELDEPLEKKLRDAGVELTPGQPLVVLLDQWRGARVVMEERGAEVKGTILSGRLASMGKEQGQRQELTLLLDSGELRVISLESVSRIRLEDARLQGQLQAALLAYAQSRTQEKRSVFIDGAGQGARSLAARYVAPAPVWKSSYRLTLPESGEGMLEGWAIVENNTGEDWSKVELTVVSGRPVSFISRLYEPRYVRRQVASLPEDEAAAPELYAGALADEAMKMEVAEAPAAAPMARELRSGVVGGIVGATPGRPMMSSVAAAAAAREAGDLFEYRFAAPVSARRGESLLLPFVQQKIAARRLLVYSDRSSVNPRAAAELTNNTGKTLDGGPITVAQDGAYAGEALMETFKAGDKRLISYAVDLGTRITTNLDSGTSVVRQISASRGVITTRSAVEMRTTYTVNNVDARAKTLVVEHPISSGVKLVSPQAVETTADKYRFSVNLPPNGRQALTVVEERELMQTTQVGSMTPDTLVRYIQNKALSAGARQQLEQIAALKRELAGVEAEIGRLNSEIAVITKDQDRIRQNLSALRQVAGQEQRVQGYAAELQKGDTRMAEARDRQAELEKRQTAVDERMKALIEGLQF